MVQPCKVARNEFQKLVKASGAVGAEQLAEVVKNNSADMLTFDPLFGVELALYAVLCGSGSEERLKRDIMAFMPTKDEAKTPPQVSNHLQQLVAKETFKFASKGAQGKVTTIQRYIGRLVDDRAPNMEAGADCDVVKEIISTFQHFVRFDRGKKEKGVVTGWEALEQIALNVKNKVDKGQAKTGDVQPLVVYSWLVPSAHKERIDALVKTVKDASGAVFGKASASKKGAKAAGSAAHSSGAASSSGAGLDEGESAGDASVKVDWAMFS